MRMVKIRLSRIGTKKRPFYHIVVADSRCKRTGRIIENIGLFNPIAVDGEEGLRINMERAEHWVNCGAQPTERVVGLIKRYTAVSEQAATAAD